MSFRRLNDWALISQEQLGMHLGVGSSLGSSMAHPQETWDKCLADVPVSIPKHTLACHTLMQLPYGHCVKKPKMSLA